MKDLNLIFLKAFEFAVIIERSFSIHCPLTSFPLQKKLLKEPGQILLCCGCHILGVIFKDDILVGSLTVIIFLSAKKYELYLDNIFDAI